MPKFNDFLRFNSQNNLINKCSVDFRLAELFYYSTVFIILVHSFFQDPLFTGMTMTNKKKKYWTGIYAISIVVFIVLQFLLDAPFFDSLREHIELLKKVLSTMALLAVILLVRSVLEILVNRLDKSRGERYNLTRVIRLVALLFMVYVVLTTRFEGTYAFVTGLGLASLILGFALQSPISSFIGWLYIIFRNPYQVGDRIQIDKHRGDVVEIGYLDTIIRECNGDYLGNDRLSGRLVYFPNSIILKDRVLNSSGQDRPFIWNETAIQIAYTSDLEFVEACMLKATDEDFKRTHPSHATENPTRWKADVYFRNNSYAWMEAVVSYPVAVTDTTGRRNRILRGVLPLLNAHPEKVQFPSGQLR